MDKRQEVHPAVQMLLDRMDRCPEDFVNDPSWMHCYQPYKSVWNAREKELFKKRHREVMLGHMEKVIAAKLLGVGRR